MMLNRITYTWENFFLQWIPNFLFLAATAQIDRWLGFFEKDFLSKMIVWHERFLLRSLNAKEDDARASQKAHLGEWKTAN